MKLYQNPRMKHLFNRSSSPIIAENQYYIDYFDDGIYYYETDSSYPVLLPKGIPVNDNSISANNSRKRQDYNRLKLYILIRDALLDNDFNKATELSKVFEFAFGKLIDNKKHFEKDPLWSRLEHVI